jgi:hypothetical protein
MLRSKGRESIKVLPTSLAKLRETRSKSVVQIEPIRNNQIMKNFISQTTRNLANLNSEITRNEMERQILSEDDEDQYNDSSVDNRRGKGSLSMDSDSDFDSIKKPKDFEVRWSHSSVGNCKDSWEPRELKDAETNEENEKTFEKTGFP